MGENLLEVRNLDVAYSHVRALQGVGIDIPEGKVVALIGPNGAGKTSLLRAISGVKRAAAGSVSYAGAAIDRSPPHIIAQSGLVQVPESREIFRTMTVYENLQVAFENLDGDRSAADERFASVFELFPLLKQRRDSTAGDLSGGQQQMLAIARALMGKPRLLMLDEPSLGLARVIIREIYLALRVLNQRGVTILLVEQNAASAIRFADYSYVLVGGKVRLHGAREKMLGSEDVVTSYLGGHIASEPAA